MVVCVELSFRIFQPRFEKLPQQILFGNKVINYTILNIVAWGIFHDEMNLTGWDRLYVHSSFAYEDPKQVYAAGFVEGNTKIIIARKTNISA